MGPLFMVDYWGNLQLKNNEKLQVAILVDWCNFDPWNIYFQSNWTAPFKQSKKTDAGKSWENLINFTNFYAHVCGNTTVCSLHDITFLLMNMEILINIINFKMKTQLIASMKMNKIDGMWMTRLQA